MKHQIIIIAAAILLFACSDKNSHFDMPATEAETSTPSHAAEAAEEIAPAEPASYDESAFDVPLSAPNTWNGYTCVDDCSGHQAGYDWAEENGIDDDSDCDGNSDSFNEGCEEYVQENEMGL